MLGSQTPSLLHRIFQNKLKKGTKLAQTEGSEEIASENIVKKKERGNTRTVAKPRCRRKNVCETIPEKREKREKQLKRGGGKKKGLSKNPQKDPEEIGSKGRYDALWEKFKA